MQKSLLVAVALLAFGSQSRAADLVVFSTGSMSEPMKEIGEEFMHHTGHKLTYVIGTTGALQTRLRAGEHSDVIAISAEGADALAKEGRFSGAREPFARSVIAIAVKAGTRMPDISTPDKFKQAMLNAKSISISDPALSSISGVYILALFEKMGIAEEMKRKTLIKPVGIEVATAVAKGEAEIGVTFRSELMPNKGVTVSETFPEAIQSPTLYVVGVSSTTKAAEAARAFAAYTLTPESQAKLKPIGVEPAARPH